MARIWLEYLKVHSVDGVSLEEEVNDPQTGETIVQLVTVPQSMIEMLKATVKIDITPKSVYDRFAQEQTIENLMIQGFFNAQRVGELEVYGELLDDDSVAPKVKIKEAVEKIKEQQRRIAQIQAEAQLMQQRAQQFLMGDPDEQADQISDAQMQLEAQYAQQEQALDEQVPTEEVDESTQ